MLENFGRFSGISVNEAPSRLVIGRCVWGALDGIHVVPHPQLDSRSAAHQAHLAVIMQGEDCFLRTAHKVLIINTDSNIYSLC